MPELNIVHASSMALICALQGWPQTHLEKQERQQLMTLVVVYAFESRSATVLTISPMKWSIGNSLPEPHRLHGGKHGFLFNYVESCSRPLLTDIAESEDFQRGLLYLCAGRITEASQVVEILDDAITASHDLVVPDWECLALLGDGRRAYWFHPARNPNYLESDLSSTAENVGWRTRAVYVSDLDVGGRCLATE